MPRNDARRVHTANRDYFDRADTGERSFPSIEAEKAHDLACAVIEQAVYDWMSLKYGKLAYFVTSNDHFLIKRGEVESFFQSEWFEYLMRFCLPNIEPATVRKQLKIAEPERRKPCVSC